MSRSIHVYDYVNHSYETVKAALEPDAAAVFSDATKVAARRANSIASELHANVAGIDFGTDIDIEVKEVDLSPKSFAGPERTTIQIEWKASKMPRLFPVMKAVLSIYPLTSTETQLDLEGEYDVPLGPLGDAIDAVAGHRIAEASVHRFISDVAAYLRQELG
ncbi:MAG: hypothetical protein DWQ47_01035 [Acidobacteria bacterium]|nr:MAG: hypothetical protein DWQ32_11495 [Acidobacteriota bacterium]REK04087.1 MAG: hypothetical protein DWQ38_01020 [Acidobacteriota bacterium]REK15249.1 MAG: hypothetical protein DWQ43_17185 [Acidobacteriota bacterium]REK46339.1 MAG: hypothetical protein DWQ47_01035 [Acidobacteriota bacterium]